jgi:hypothetical protein
MDIFEEFKNILAVFGQEGETLVAAVQIVERLVQRGGEVFLKGLDRFIGELDPPQRKAVGFFVAVVFKRVENGDEEDDASAFGYPFIHG